MHTQDTYIHTYSIIETCEAKTESLLQRMDEIDYVHTYIHTHMHTYSIIEMCEAKAESLLQRIDEIDHPHIYIHTYTYTNIHTVS